MARGGRPGRPSLARPARLIRLTLSLRPGEDDDLLAFFDQIPAGGRAQAVMTALRQGGGVGGGVVHNGVIDEAELLAALDELLF